MNKMNEALRAVLYQAIGYGFAMFLGVGILAFMQRGFLIKFLIVKASLGRKVLIRVRGVHHWMYYVGNWAEGDLIFGSKKDKKRINNIASADLYRSLGLNWVDLDGKTWEILPPNTTDSKNAFDPEKQESLVTRALYKPPIEDIKDKILLILVILAIVAGAVSAYFGYNILNEVGTLQANIAGLKSGLVVPTS